MKKLKVMTVVGTRPELIKLSRVIALLEAHTEHVLVHTGQNFDYELQKIFFEDLGIKMPQHMLSVAGESASETVAKVIEQTDKLLSAVDIDAILVLGDTNSCLCVLAAKRRKIPIFHMEAGNRCFDLRVPEEINRKVVDHLSDVNFPYTEHARKYLLDERLPANLVIKTGSPMREVLKHYQEKISNSAILKSLNLTPDSYFVVSLHREENVDDPSKLKNILIAILKVSEAHGKKVVMSVHPRTKKKLSDIESDIPNFHAIALMKPLGFTDYIALQQSASCVLSDSGTLSEESSICGFPSVMIRDCNERPEVFEGGTTVMGGTSQSSIECALGLVMNMNKSPKVNDYEESSVSDIVVRAIFSYTPYVNRYIWHKE